MSTATGAANATPTNGAGSANNTATNSTNQNGNANNNQQPRDRFNNDRRNDRYRNNNRNQQNQFKPKNESIEPLSSSDEKRRQDFSKFQKSLNHYVMTTYKNSKDLSGCVMDFTNPISQIERERKSLIDIRKSDIMYAVEPPKSGESEEDKFIRESNNADKRTMVQTLYTQHIKSISERTQQCEQNMTILWTDILGQCSPALQEELHGDPDYTSRSASFDAIWLIQTLQKLTVGANKTTNKYFSIFKAAKSFFNTTQQSNEPLDEYYTRFESAKDLVELFDAKLIDFAAVLAAEQTVNSSVTMEDIQQKFYAMSLIMNANKKRYEGLWNKLQNDLLMNQDSYPTTIGTATHLLTNWKGWYPKMCYNHFQMNTY